jgi:hypothetical protein
VSELEHASGKGKGIRIMPGPTADDLLDPEFNAIWEVIKSWDVNVPDAYDGYCGANGSHVMIILNALRRSKV